MATPSDPWLRNPGYKSAFVEGRRVYVRLRNGMQPAESWGVDWFGGANGARWSLTGDDWDIIEFRLAA